MWLVAQLRIGDVTTRENPRSPPASGWAAKRSMQGNFYGLHSGTPWEFGKHSDLGSDVFSKQVHFVLCQKIPSAHTLAKLFVQHVYRLQFVLKLPPLHASCWLPQSLTRARRGFQSPNGQLIGAEAHPPWRLVWKLLWHCNTVIGPNLAGFFLLLSCFHLCFSAFFYGLSWAAGLQRHPHLTTHMLIYQWHQGEQGMWAAKQVSLNGCLPCNCNGQASLQS